MRPKTLDPNFSPVPMFEKRPELHSLREAIRNSCVQLGCDFAAASLRLDHASQGDEIGGCIFSCDLPLREQFAEGSSQRGLTTGYRLLTTQ